MTTTHQNTTQVEENLGNTETDPSYTKRYILGEVRILVLDDDARIGELIQSILASLEFTVDAVSDPTHMENALRSNPYHVIILDYFIPSVDSEIMMEWIRDFQPDAAIVVVTAFPSIDSALQCLRARIDDYITKPFGVDQLRNAVMLSLKSRGLLRLSEEALREQIGAAIRERRKAQSLTLADLAKRTNVSVSYLSQVELGKNSASVEMLYRVALGLRVRVADLFEGVQS